MISLTEPHHAEQFGLRLVRRDATTMVQYSTRGLTAVYCHYGITPTGLTVAADAIATAAGREAVLGELPIEPEEVGLLLVTALFCHTDSAVAIVCTRGNVHGLTAIEADEEGFTVEEEGEISLFAKADHPAFQRRH